MRLSGRLDALARRVPDTPIGGEDAINRAVFRHYEREQEAARAAAPARDHAADARDFERAAQECDAAGVDIVAEMEAAFARFMAAEAAEHGPWLTIAGVGRIREGDYRRLRARVAGERDAAHRAP